MREFKQKEQKNISTSETGQMKTAVATNDGAIKVPQLSPMNKDGSTATSKPGFARPVGAAQAPLQKKAVAQKQEAEHTPVQLNFSQYVSSISRLEALARADGFSNTQIISAIRKLYYNSGNWNTVIAGAAATGVPPSWQQEANSPTVENVAASQVVTINGEAVDVGHLLTGLDAGNFERAFGLSKAGIELFSFRSNKEFATFVGDLGSVVEAYIDQERSIWTGNVPRDNGIIAEKYNELAGNADMAGNVDSYAMSYNIEQSFASNLLAYYSGSGRSDNRRYTNFAREIGLGTFQNGDFTGNTEAFRAGLQTEVYNFAMAFQMRNGAWEGITSWGGTMHFGNVSSWVVEHFINDLKTKVQNESN